MKYLALTGATGLLGSYLLKDLLSQDIPVLALIRSSRREIARQRIEGILRYFESHLGRALPRPVIMETDLHKPELGLNKDQIHWISQHVDAVVHSAASLAFQADEKGEPYVSNVAGLEHVLQMCQSANIRKFHHVSTCYVCGSRKGVVLETELDEGQTFSNDYEKSKLEGEKMVHSCSFLDSLTIYRPAIIVGDQHTGHTSTYNGFYTPIKIMLPFFDPTKITDELFTAFSHSLGMNQSDRKNFVPVDWISQVMTHVISRPELHEKTYHLTAANRISMEDMTNAIIESIQKYVKVDADHPAMPFDSVDQLLKVFAGQMEMYKSYWRDDPEFDMTNTIQAAPQLPPPTVTYETLLRLIRFAIQSKCGWPRPKPTPLENDVQQVFDAYDKSAETQLADAPLDGSFTLRVIGRGGGDWTVNQNNGQTKIYQGLVNAPDVPMLTMRGETFQRLPEMSDADILVNVTWKNMPIEKEAQSIQALRDIKLKTVKAE